MARRAPLARVPRVNARGENRPINENGAPPAGSSTPRRRPVKRRRRPFSVLTMLAHEWDNPFFCQHSMRLLANDVMPVFARHTEQPATVPSSIFAW
jgi:hypothetical protein